MTPQELTRLLTESIPLCQFMQFEVTGLDADSIVCQAPFEPNKNVHNTGFAGSLYALSVASGWALVYNRLIESKANGALVIKEANIRYRKPVTGPITCIAKFDDLSRDISIPDALLEISKVYLTVNIEYQSDGVTCGNLTGNYVIVRK